MGHRLIKQAVVTYVPAIAEVIAQPAHWDVSYDRQQVVHYGGGNKPGGVIPIYGFYRDSAGNVIQGIVGYTSGVIYGAYPYLVWEDVAVYHYWPAVAGVRGRDALVTTDNQLGWNAGAESAAVLDGDFILTCLIPITSVGVLVGIMPAGATVANYNTLTHAVLVSALDDPRVIESGVQVSGTDPTFRNTDLRIIRRDRTITYYVGENAPIVSARESAGPVVMAAVMYAASDTVDTPGFVQAAYLQSQGDWQWGEALGFSNLVAHSTWQWAGNVTLNDGVASMVIDLTMNAMDEDRGSAHMVMDIPTLSATMGFVQIEAIGFVLNVPFTLSALAIDGDVGQAQDTFDLTMHSGDYDYGDAVMVIDGWAMFSQSTEEEMGDTAAPEVFALGDYYVVDPVLYAYLNSTLQIGTTIDLLLFIDAHLADHLALFDGADMVSIIQAVLTNRLEFSDSASNVSRMLLQYATNLASGAVGRYQGYEFEGFCRVGMQTYGYKRDGLYLLGADDDNGQLISALVDFAAENFATTQGKRLSNLYLGLSTDGQVFVRMTDDNDNDVTYLARQRKTEYRADMQQGKTSRFWRMRLEIVDATHASLDNVEWVAAATGRRTSS